MEGYLTALGIWGFSCSLDPRSPLASGRWARRSGWPCLEDKSARWRGRCSCRLNNLIRCPEGPSPQRTVMFYEGGRGRCPHSSLPLSLLPSTCLTLEDHPMVLSCCTFSSLYLARSLEGPWLCLELAIGAPAGEWAVAEAPGWPIPAGVKWD